MTKRAELQVDAFRRRLGGEQDCRLIAKMLDERRTNVYSSEPEARPVSRFFSTHRS